MVQCSFLFALWKRFRLLLSYYAGEERGEKERGCVKGGGADDGFVVIQVLHWPPYYCAQTHVLWSEYHTDHAVSTVWSHYAHTVTKLCLNYAYTMPKLWSHTLTLCLHYDWSITLTIPCPQYLHYHTMSKSWSHCDQTIIWGNTITLSTNSVTMSQVLRMTTLCLST